MEVGIVNVVSQRPTRFAAHFKARYRLPARRLKERVKVRGANKSSRSCSRSRSHVSSSRGETLVLRAWSADERDFEYEGAEDDAGVGTSWEEDDNMETETGGGEGQRSRGAVRLDSLALGGTVASTCLVALVGVSEAPLFLLAMPVVLPMLALIAYRERTRRQHRRELSLALQSQQSVTSKVDDLAVQSTKASDNVRDSIERLSHRLASMEDKMKATADVSEATQTAMEDSFTELMRLNKSATNHVLKEQVKNMKRIVADELLVASNANLLQSDDDENRTAQFIEVSLLDVKRELSELENIQTDLLRLVETMYDESKASVKSLGSVFGEEEWLKDELNVMRSNLVVDLEDVVVRNTERMSKEVSELGPSGSNAIDSGRVYQMEDQLIELRQVAEGNQQSIRDLQDALYSSVEQLQKQKPEMDSDQIVDEIRGMSTSVDTLVEALDAVQSLPSTVETFAEDVKEAIRDSVEVVGSAATSKEEVSNNTNTTTTYNNITSNAVFTSSAVESLEKKIDNLTRATVIFEKLAAQLSELNPQKTQAFTSETEGTEKALPPGGSVSKIEDAVEKEDTSKSNGESNPEWLEYTESDSRELEPVKEGAQTSSPPLSSSKEIEEDVPVVRDRDESSAKEEEMEGSSSDAIEPNNVDGLSVEELLGEGLRALKRGRQELREGDGINSNSESSFIQAMKYFDTVIEIDPNSVAAHGNKGNALLAYARQKMKVLSTFAQEARDNPFMNEQSIKMSEDLTKETNDFLIESGRCFRTVLSLNSRDPRALLNWGNALCLRAKLVGKRDVDSGLNLYDAALEKFEASLMLDDSPVTREAMNAALFDLQQLESTTY